MIFLVFIYGIVIGSFLNVCIYRIPQEKSIVYPPSSCMKCGYKLMWKDLLPILSYITLKGKCRGCNEKISIRYPLVELMNGILYVLLFLNLGFDLMFIQFSFLTSLLIVIALIDFDTHYIYTSTIVLGLVVGVFFLISNYFINKVDIKDNIMGLVLGIIIIGAIVIITKSMGEGDVEIAALCGLYFGYKGILIMLFSTFIIGGIVGVIILALKLKDRKSEIAFAPYLVLGGFIVMLFGEKILSLYSNFLF